MTSVCCITSRTRITWSLSRSSLLSASSLQEKSLPAVLNSDEGSRAKDKEMKLEKFVRLSFNDENPMKYVAKNEKRISRAVMLKIKLEVSRPGVVFFDCNATHHDAIGSTSPSVVHFDVVKAANQFAVAPVLRRFYQAEVLVPSPLPPHLIVFPEHIKGQVSRSGGSGVRALGDVENVETKVKSVSRSPTLPGGLSLVTVAIARVLKGIPAFVQNCKIKSCSLF